MYECVCVFLCVCGCDISYQVQTKVNGNKALALIISKIPTVLSPNLHLRGIINLFRRMLYLFCILKVIGSVLRFVMQNKKICLTQIFSMHHRYISSSIRLIMHFNTIKSYFVMINMFLFVNVFNSVMVI